MQQQRQGLFQPDVTCTTQRIGRDYTKQLRQRVVLFDRGNLHDATTAGGRNCAKQLRQGAVYFPDNLHDPTNRQGLREATQAEGIEDEGDPALL